MIRYSLRCADGHEFESWFQSADAFAALQDAKFLHCPDCGSDSVAKAVMAPRVSTGLDASTRGSRSGREGSLEKLRRQIEETSDYVGSKFAWEARAMHLGDRPMRTIHGEAAPEEARALIEDGVPIAPLPFIPKAHRN